MDIKIFRFLLKATLTTVALLALVYVVGWRLLLQSLEQTNVIWLLAMYGISLCLGCLDAAQMRLLMRKAGANLPLSRIILANSLSTFYSLILPGDLFASAAKWSNLSAATGRKSIVLNAIVYNRFALLIPPFLFGAVAVSLENPFSTVGVEFTVIAISLLMVAIALLIFHPRTGSFVDSTIMALAQRLPDGVTSRVGMVLRSLQVFRKFSFLDHLAIYAFSCLALPLRIMVFWCGSNALSLEVPVLALAWIFALLMFTRQFPITFSNLGVREGILILALAPYAIESSSAFALGILLFSNILLWALVGAGYQIALALGWASWGPPNAGTEESNG